MAYNFITQFDSPNYTPASETQVTWGRRRIVEAIAIHWWGDPSTNPSFEGVVAHLCNPSSGSSAHYVATGTGRRVACLVDPDDNSWATNSANPFTVSIECDPRCRDEDYDVVAELVCELRSTYGDVPLVPHNQYLNTRCPGNYNLARIDEISRRKIAGDREGMAQDVQASPTPEPSPAPQPVQVTPVATPEPAQAPVAAQPVQTLPEKPQTPVEAPTGKSALAEAVKELLRVGILAVVAWGISHASGIQDASLKLAVLGVLRAVDKYIHENKSIPFKGLIWF